MRVIVGLSSPIALGGNWVKGTESLILWKPSSVKMYYRVICESSVLRPPDEPFLKSTCRWGSEFESSRTPSRPIAPADGEQYQGTDVGKNDPVG